MSDQPHAGAGRAFDRNSGYAPVNGLSMYYEIHGAGEPLVLLHGALSATDTSFGLVLPELAKNRRVIAVEQQAHGRTADVDRPLTVAQLADDTAALLEYLGIAGADLFAYSMGTGIALELAIRRPELVRRMVLVSAVFDLDGFVPGLLAGIEQITPQALAGTPFEAEYLRTAPNPDDWPTLIRKVQEFDRNIVSYPREAVAGITAPTLVVIGDSDIVRPEHAVEMFRLVAGDLPGDGVTPARSQLAILPGTSHISIMTRADLLLSIVPRFLDAPLPG